MSHSIGLPELSKLSVQRLHGVGPKKLASLSAVGINNLYDLLTYYPRRYIDRTNQAQIGEMAPGDSASLLVNIDSVDSRRIRGGKVMVTASVSDDTGILKLTFFNQPWRSKQLKSGEQAMIYGKVDLYKGQRQITNPVVDLVGNRTGRVIPVYPQSEKSGLHTWDIAEWVSEALRRMLPPKGRGLSDPLPEWIIEEQQICSRQAAINGIHQPENLDQVYAAKKRLVFDELFRMQLALVKRKRHIARTEVGVSHRTDGPLVKQLHSELPFKLTAAQQNAIDEIAADMASPVPMHRLLQGDVGAGKTLVAAVAMAAAVDGGHQAALMAPTEVLAEQHYKGISDLCRNLNIEEKGSLFEARPLCVELLTNSTPTSDRKRILNGLLIGKVDIIIGTHSLISERVMFSSLGLAVVDEQHRFGVEQRSALREKSDGDTSPDILVMTATPIPRTAAMTVYGDLDMSVLDELPAGRTPVETKWIQTESEALGVADLGHEVFDAIWETVAAELDDGHQAYIVCPLIDESAKIDVSSAEEVYDFLSNELLVDYSIGILHGRLDDSVKEDVMARFKAGEIQLLVSTTVIEVGVDVPNATVMVVLDADRFGIAQLHQLRGRVGRSDLQSSCFLLTGEVTEESSARLVALTRSADGFELADIDLDLRGEGTIFGDRQKGTNDLGLASLRRDKEVVIAARNMASRLLDSDPELASHPELLSELESFAQFTDDEYLMKN